MIRDRSGWESMKKLALRPPAVFMVISCAASWGIWLIGILSVPGLSGVGDERFGLFLLLATFAPTLAAFVASGWLGGRGEATALLKSCVKLKVNWKVYLLVFFLLPIVGIGLYVACGVPARIELWKIAITAIPLMPVNAVMAGIVFGAGPLGEEAGWRGFLQARLQGTMNPVVTAVVIGLAWALWHLPIAFFFQDFRNGLTLPQFLALYPVSTILISYAMGHLWRWSGGSTFIAILFHAVMNQTASYLVSVTFWDFGAMTALQVYLLVLAAFALMTSFFEVLSRTAFSRFRTATAVSGHGSGE